MIASRGALYVLAAIAAALAIAVAIDRPPPTVDRAVFADLATEHVQALTWSGTHALAVRRTEHGWMIDQTPPLPADAATVADVLAAVRGARWHRREAVSAAGAIRVTLSITGDRAETVAIGEALPGGDQMWLVRGEHALLVDGWVARALAPDPLALHVRHPLGDAASAPAIAVGDVKLSGHPRRAGALLVDPELVRALHDALADVELVSLGPATGSLADSDRATITAGDATVEATGGCGADRVFVHATTGDGCVELARWRAALDRAAALRGHAERIVDRRPLAIDPVKLVLPDGATIDRTRRPQLDGKDADPDRVAELVAALAARAEPVALPAGKPVGSIVAGDVAIDLYDHVLARRGEPIALKPTADAWAAIARPSSAYRDPTRWLEEPTTITAITLDGATYERGAVLGEWKHARDGALVEALASAAATLRAPVGPPPARVEHHVTLVITPPAGSATRHELDLGAITQAGCAGRADGTAVALPLALCTTVAAVH